MVVRCQETEDGYRSSVIRGRKDEDGRWKTEAEGVDFRLGHGRLI
ncbi:MAG: hypothetical protein PHP26_10845 [Syntrophomonas sp.]|nr:hypothetical protein [Syntrophomonas sp.]